MTPRAAALDLVLELTLLLGEDLKRGLADLGLTQSRTHLLWTVASLGPSTQRVLADTLQVAPRTVTSLVDALAETGFVTREPHPSDRRATLVTLTPHGIEVAASLQAGHVELAGQLFGDLEPAAYDAFLLGLTSTVEKLRALL